MTWTQEEKRLLTRATHHALGVTSRECLTDHLHRTLLVLHVSSFVDWCCGHPSLPGSNAPRTSTTRGAA